MSDQHAEKFVSQYTLGSLLGSGGFGSVYEGIHKKDGQQVALMKAVSKPPQSENILQLLDWFDIPNYVLLVLERPIPCMDVYCLCRNLRGLVPESLAKLIILQVENLLFNTNTMEVKLIDFGCGGLWKDTPCHGYEADVYQNLCIKRQVRGDPVRCRLQGPELKLQKCFSKTSKDCSFPDCASLFIYLVNVNSLLVYDHHTLLNLLPSFEILVQFGQEHQKTFCPPLQYMGSTFTLVLGLDDGGQIHRLSFPDHCVRGVFTTFTTCGRLLRLLQWPYHRCMPLPRLPWSMLDY